MAPRRRKKRKKKTFAALAVEGYVEAGGRLLEAPCPWAHSCGGCSWQQIPGEHQLQFKADFIREAFAAQGLGDLPFAPVTAAPAAYGYRNHMEFSFSARRWLTEEEIASGQAFARDYALGLHVPGGFGRVLDLEACLLQSESMNQVLAACRSFTRGHPLPPYDHREHTGFWRYLVLRESASTGDLLVHIVTRTREEEVMAQFCQYLREACPRVSSITNGVTDRLADTSSGAFVHVDFGPGLIVETMDGLTFEISPTSFFQPNSATAALLFTQVQEMAARCRARKVVDLFCGTGTLSLVMARTGAEVLGLELVEEAVECARQNAARQGLDCVRFEVCDLMSGQPLSLEGVDLVIADPPRAGMHKKTMRQLVEAAPPAILSVGCNPKTQAENIRELIEKVGYEVCEMRALDQFPQTPHVESLVLLVKP